MAESVKSYCRVCQAFCGYEVLVEDGRIVRLRGDDADPMSEGYACFKGIRHAELYRSPNRLTRSQRRVDDRFVPAPSDEILDEAGTRLKAIIERHGPEAVGFFIGTQALFNASAPPTIHAFAKALPTPRVFTTMTIDQSAKWVGEFRLGAWAAGPQPFDTAEVWMFVGSNPMVSMVAGAGANQFAFTNAAKRMQRAKARGMKVIVIDPRLTETAQLADLHLQLRPGSDAQLAAALIHQILREGWQDQAFCDAYADQLEHLRQAVAPFAPEAWADHIGVSAVDIGRAAEMFAKARSGMAGTGTGPDMARHSNTAEHLYQALNVLCGRFPRMGERAASPRVLRPSAQVSADVVLPPREWEFSGPRSLTHGLGRMKGVMMSAEIPGEITHPSKERMRAMICVGGNLAVALPDQARAEAALSALELLVVIDPVMTATARLADYVIAPKLQYERADHTAYLEGMYQTPFAHVTAPVVPPPPGADVVDDWYALWRISRAAGLTLQFHGETLPTEAPPVTEDLLEILARGSAVTYAELAATAGAQAPSVTAPIVTARATNVRFQLLPADVAAELAAVRAGAPAGAEPGPAFQLIVRRHKETMNSTGVANAATRKLYPYNPLYIHPDDLAGLDAAADDLLAVTRGKATIGGSAKPDASLRRGVIAMSHGWSGRPDSPWEATNALVDADEGAEAINHMPIMTGIRVTVAKLSPGHPEPPRKLAN